MGSAQIAGQIKEGENIRERLMAILSAVDRLNSLANDFVERVEGPKPCDPCDSKSSPSNMKDMLTEIELSLCRLKEAMDSIDRCF